VLLDTATPRALPQGGELLAQSSYLLLSFALRIIRLSGCCANEKRRQAENYSSYNFTPHTPPSYRNHQD